MEGNSFTCEVVIFQKDEVEGEEDILANFPCSPAFFGKASLTHIRQSEDSKVVKGLLRPPPVGNELGCDVPEENTSLVLDDKCPADELQDERTTVQMLRRGACNFMSKAENHKHAEGIIVINSNPFELFVMAGEKPQPGSQNDDDADLPVSVLVSGEDGNAILRLLYEEKKRGNTVEAHIQLLRQDGAPLVNRPFVKGSQDALKILTTNGWGIHAVPQSDPNQAANKNWQLFIIQHEQHSQEKSKE